MTLKEIFNNIFEINNLLTTKFISDDNVKELDFLFKNYNKIPNLVLLGQSGAGKSVALRVLEDLGYYCVDNLPVNLLNQFVKTVGGRNQNVAVSVDIRNLPNNEGSGYIDGVGEFLMVTRPRRRTTRDT